MAQALAQALHGQEFRSLTQSAVLDRIMPLTNSLPRRPRELWYAIAGVTEAVSGRRIRRLDFGGISSWLAALYPEGPWPAAFIGASNGAAVHLGAAVGAPFLPQTFLCPVRRLGGDPDDARAGFKDGQPVVQALLETLPDISVHHMHDPNQDRLMLQTMSYFRLKHRRLPAPYRDALVRWLPAGATLYLLDCTKRWPVTRTSPHSVFQFGAMGGATLEEYFRGGPRARSYFARYRSRRERWEPPEPNDEAPEAEWGFEPELRADLVALAREREWRLVTIRFEEPEELSIVAARLHRSWYGDNGLPRLIADSFVLTAPLRTQRLRAVPFWLMFATEPSAERLRRFLDQEGPFRAVDLMLFSHGTEGIGLAPVAAWQTLAQRGQTPGRLLGVDPSEYPRDFATFARFHRDLETLGPVHEPPPRLNLTEFEALLRRHAAGTGVTLETATV